MCCELLRNTGRPFNRPLMWDFPGDPKTWELAERGIGDNGGSGGGSSAKKPSNGDFVVLAGEQVTPTNSDQLLAFCRQVTRHACAVSLRTARVDPRISISPLFWCTRH
jgi:hypothetical protein